MSCQTQKKPKERTTSQPVVVEVMEEKQGGVGHKGCDLVPVYVPKLVHFYTCRTR